MDDTINQEKDLLKKWENRYAKACVRATDARRKYHKTKSCDNEVDMYAALEERAVIGELLKDLRKM